MKKVFLSSLLFLNIVIFNNCSSNNTAGGQVNPNTIGSPFTVKYEIISSSPMITSNGSNIGVMYMNASGQEEISQDLVSGSTTWSKTLNITTSSRPLQIIFSPGGGGGVVYLASQGNVTLNMYINGSLKGSITNGSQLLSGGINLCSSLLLQYVVN
jgi:hypothetical protein